MKPHPMSTTLVATLLMIALVMGGSPLAAETLQSQLEAANQAYWAEDYDKARQGFASLAATFDLDDPAIWYNLGTAAFKSGHLGEAVLAYRKALMAGASGEVGDNVEANLALARATLAERYQSDVLAAQLVMHEGQGLLYDIVTTTSERGWTYALSVLLVLLVAMALVTRWIKRLPRVLVIVVLALTLLTGGLLMGNVFYSGTLTIGVVTEQNAKAREALHPDAPSFDVPEGAEVLVIQPSDDGALLKVRLSNGQTGWLPQGEVGILQQGS